MILQIDITNKVRLKQEYKKWKIGILKELNGKAKTIKYISKFITC